MLIQAKNVSIKEEHRVFCSHVVVVVGNVVSVLIMKSNMLIKCCLM